jgi:hypothetical protein
VVAAAGPGELRRTASRVTIGVKNCKLALGSRRKRSSILWPISVCVRTVGAVGTQFSPAACLAALLRAAADSGVSREQGIAIIAQTVRGWGLIFPELDALKRQEAADPQRPRAQAVSIRTPGATTAAEMQPSIEPKVTSPKPVVPAEPVTTGAAPKGSSGSRKADVIAFLRDVLANGPVAAKEIEERAIEVGLLEAGKSIGDAKVFRTARSALGVTTVQRSGLKAGGWVWSLPDQASSTLLRESESAAPAAAARGVGPRTQHPAAPTERPLQPAPVAAKPEPQAAPAVAATPALPGPEADPVEWKVLKDQIFAVYSRYGLMPDFGTVDVWRTQHKLDPKLIWPLIGYHLEQRIRLDPMASLRHFTPMVTRGAVARDFCAGAPTVTSGLAPPVNGENLVAPQINGSPTWKVAPPHRYLKGAKGAIIAAEQIPPEDWIFYARRYREHGDWPPTLGPPPGKPGSSCPPELAKEAS